LPIYWDNGSVLTLGISFATNNEPWQINASSSPYEGEDDFFVRQTQDDITLNTSRSFRRVSGVPVDAGRPRGKSESLNASTGSRPPSVLGVAHA